MAVAVAGVRMPCFASITRCASFSAPSSGKAAANSPPRRGA